MFRAYVRKEELDSDGGLEGEPTPQATRYRLQTPPSDHNGMYATLPGTPDLRWESYAVVIPIENNSVPSSTNGNQQLLQSTPESGTTEEKPESSTTEEKPECSTVEEKPGSSTTEEKPESSTTEKKPESSTVEEKPGSSTTEEKPESSTTEEKPV
ncbi:Hypp8597 [Branchiostoma lanceolatum]|uniref:Hypp8597 protein n=1 Tax=Branchiostoma lanceolatum TaxID=7740 RepID=A0A8K0EF61_BRALA|nr:Hypp8597 [Branchiostoma lanceolatum]